MIVKVEMWVEVVCKCWNSRDGVLNTWQYRYAAQIGGVSMGLSLPISWHIGLIHYKNPHIMDTRTWPLDMGKGMKAWNTHNV